MEVLIIIGITSILYNLQRDLSGHLYQKRQNAIPTKYDPHYTRKLEQQEFGYKATRCEDDNCNECFSKALPQPPKGSAGVAKKSKAKTRPTGEGLGRGLGRCSTCKVPLDYDGWCSNGCVKAYRDNIKAYSDSLKKAIEERLAEGNHHTPIVMPAENRYRVINGYRVRIPDRVPADAYCQEMYDPSLMRDMLLWKWTDPETGKSMFYKSPGTLDVDHRPLAIGTERIRK